MGEKQKATMLGSMLVICNALGDMKSYIERCDIDDALCDMDGNIINVPHDIPEKVRKKIKEATKTMNEAYAIMHAELYADELHAKLYTDAENR